jgi:release factor glutamine methyltransferase
VVSNPPYVASGDRETLAREVREFEPAEALFGGEDGFAVYRRLEVEGRRLLRPGGRIYLEFGMGQAGALREMFAEWENVSIFEDLAGIERVLLARRRR